MPKTSDLIPGDRLKMLFTGAPGTGKTTAIGSFPGPMKIFDFDHRLLPIQRFYPERTDIEYDQFDGRNFHKFKKDFEDLQNSCPYATVVIDSMTFLGDALIDYMVGLRGGKGGKTKGVMQLATLEDYGGESKGLLDVLNIARVIPAHFIMTAHLTIVSDDKGSYRTLMTGGKKISFKIPGWFDEVYHFKAGPSMDDGNAVEYKVYTKPTGDDYGCKTNFKIPYEIDVTDKPFFSILQELLLEQGITIGGDKTKTEDTESI